MNLRRLRDLVVNGKSASATIAQAMDRNRWYIWGDVIYCGYRYKMPVKDYVSLNVFTLSREERNIIGKKVRKSELIHDAWMKDFLKNRRFFAKYSKQKYELGIFRVFRQRAYTRRYHAGENLHVESSVYISRQHGLSGNIQIGKNCFLGKNSTIDYSGNLIIGDNVRITKGVDIQTHHHLYHSNWKIGNDIIEPQELTIGEGTVIGTNAIIMPSCHNIGKYARIGAGAVVTKDVPDFAIVTGVPAKVIRIMEE